MENPSIGSVGLGVLLTTLGGGIVWLLNYLNSQRQDKRKEKKEDESEQVKGIKDLLARVDADRKEARQEAHNVRNELMDCRMLSTRAVTWIKHLESVLDAAKVPHTKWDEMSVKKQTQLMIASPTEDTQGE